MPRPFPARVRILACQGHRQLDPPGAVLEVPPVLSAGTLEMACQVRLHRLGQHGDAVLVALACPHQDLVGGEGNVADTPSGAARHPGAAARPAPLRGSGRPAVVPDAGRARCRPARAGRARARPCRGTAARSAPGSGWTPRRCHSRRVTSGSPPPPARPSRRDAACRGTGCSGGLTPRTRLRYGGYSAGCGRPREPGRAGGEAVTRPASSRRGASAWWGARMPGPARTRTPFASDPRPLRRSTAARRGYASKRQLRKSRFRYASSPWRGHDSVLLMRGSISEPRRCHLRAEENEERAEHALVA